MGLFNFNISLIPLGDKSKFLFIISITFFTFASSPSASFTEIERGLDTPIAYANWIRHLSEALDETIFFAKYLAAYAADLSTLVGSFPENAPPPCGAEPP